MPIDLTSVLGQPAEAPAVPEAPAPVPEDGGAVPDAVLQIPEMAGLLEGTPPAVWTSRDDQSPEVQTIAQNADALQQAGFGFYGSKDGQTTVLFNTLHVSPEELQAADAKGKLRDFATPFAELQAAFSQGLGSEASPESAGAPLPQVSAGPANVPLDKKLATKRLQNLAIGDPTSGPTPGQGRLLSSIVTPTI
jgi:hypothetical protein